jgi:AcrR family transcriptional regulator
LSVFRYLNGIRSKKFAPRRDDSGTVSFVTSNSTERPMPGRQPARAELATDRERARIVYALAEEAAEKGYPEVTVADVVRRAGIARSTFYECFRSKEDCFLETQRYAMAAALERVVAAGGMAENWPQRVSAGLAAFLEFVVEEPALARAGMVDALAAGPAAVECYQESQRAFVSLFRLGRDVSRQGVEMPESLDEAVIGGVFWIVHQRLAVSEGTSILDLLPELIEFALAPYLGPGAARQLAADQTQGRGKI